jgi:site-specific recombinase XerD
MMHEMAERAAREDRYPGWFSEFLADRAIRKPSPHTVKAYRQDFQAIAALIEGSLEGVPALSTAQLTRDSLRTAFATYAETHSAASIRRCWSSWNTLCAFLYNAELIEDNPMPVIGRPKVPKSLPKSYPPDTVRELLAAVGTDSQQASSTNDWPERDRAIILTALLAGLRADELVSANIGDLRRADHGGVVHVRGKGNKDRRIPVERELLDVLDVYLRSRLVRIPPPRRRTAGDDPLSRFSPTAALFIGADGQRITRGTLQYRVLRAFKKAGLDGERPAGALIHGLRHTFATELANADVSVYTLMKLLGHESMATSQRYVDGAGTDTRAATQLNPLYALVADTAPQSSRDKSSSATTDSAR